jgi:hypothetical protein
MDASLTRTGRGAWTDDMRGRLLLSHSMSRAKSGGVRRARGLPRPFVRRRMEMVGAGRARRRPCGTEGKGGAPSRRPFRARSGEDCVRSLLTGV